MSSEVKLGSRALDAEIAQRVMGLIVVWICDSTVPIVLSSGLAVPHYSTSLDACREAELEIERRGLLEQYVTALWAFTHPAKTLTKIVPEIAAMAMVKADAEARCQAILITLNATN